MTAMAASSPVFRPPVTAARDTAFDFTKGLLVLFMILYHWASYFLGLEFGPAGKYYDYLRFLTPGFIFLTGFMISHVLLQRYAGTNSRLPWRLVVRGLRLVAVFVGLNLLAGLALPGSLLKRFLAGEAVLGSLASIFVSGDLAADGNTKIAVFNILVPFAYLLILSAGLIVVSRQIKYAFLSAFALTVAGVITARSQGIHSLNLELVMAGLLGVALGYVKKEQLAAILAHSYLIGGLYCAYLVAIMFWSISLPLELISVILTTSLFYIAGSRPGSPGMLRHHTILLGKYSLLGYISQIAILQIMHRITWLSQHGGAVLIGSLMMGVLLTVLTVVLVDRARHMSKAVDQMYQIVFA